MDDSCEFLLGGANRLKTKLGPSGGGALVKSFTNIRVACFCTRKFCCRDFDAAIIYSIWSQTPRSGCLSFVVRLSTLFKSFVKEALRSFCEGACKYFLSVNISYLDIISFVDERFFPSGILLSLRHFVRSPEIFSRRRR